MPVLQNCLNFHYSPCLSHWTAVRFSLQEITVTFTEYFKIYFVPSYCGKEKIFWKINIGQNLETSHWSAFRKLWIFLSRYNGLWQSNSQRRGKNEILKKILSFSGTHQHFLQQITEPIQAGYFSQKVMFVFSFTANFISSHKYVHTFHVYPTFALLRLFSFVQSVSNLQHWNKAHYSDVSNLNSGCIVFIVLHHKHLNYTYSFTGNSILFLQTMSAIIQTAN